MPPFATIDRLNPTINSIVWRNDDDARAQARKVGDYIANNPEDLPPFAGVPIPIKDLTPVKGWPVTYGSNGAPEGVSAEGELITEAFGRAGFILCCRTNTPEFGPLTVTENDRYGITRNPWDTNRSPGGSSGGAGASVAAGMFSIAPTPTTAEARSGSRHRVAGWWSEARPWSSLVTCPRLAGHGHRRCGLQDRF